MAEVSKGYSHTHCHAFYRAKTGNKIDKALYRKICQAFNKKLVEAIVAGRVVSLPHGLGTMWIRKFQTNWDKPRLNLPETKRIGKKVYYDNMHSDGWWARWYWSRVVSTNVNLQYYSFHATRKNARLVSAVMKQPDGHKRYFT